MDRGELEAIAMEGLAQAGLDPTEPPSVVDLIRRLLGPDGYDTSHVLVGGGRACLARVHGHWRVYASKAATLFDHFHEVGHYLVRQAGLGGGPDEEHLANYVGGALLMPRPAVLKARRNGFRLPELADLFSTSETCAALREAEVLTLPRVIVARTHVHVRGPEDFVWPAEPTLRKWAQKPGPGVAKTRMTDDPSRVVLDAEAV